MLDVGDVVAAATGGDASAFAQAFELGEAFDEGEGEEEEDAESAEPGGGWDSRGGGAGDDADGVEAGENDDVDQHRALETQGVGERCDEIDAEPEEEMERLDKGELRGEPGDDGGYKQGQRDGSKEKERDNDDTRESGEIARGKGTATFAGVLAVDLEVEEIVDDVGGGGSEAKAEESENCSGDESGGECVGEQQGDKEEDVFGPLMDADGFEPGLEGGDALVKAAHGSDSGFAEAGAETCGGIGDHGLFAMLEEREVG